MMRRGPQRLGVRQYNRSDVPRMQWTEELHARFVDAVHCLGGHDKATPKRILLLMSVKGVSISHVKSHLQMYRNMNNHVNFHSFLSTKGLHKKKKTNLNDVNPYGCDHLDSVDNSNNRYSFPGTSLVESSEESEPRIVNLNMSHICKDNKWVGQNQVIEMNLLHANTTNEMDRSCELTLCTYPRYQLDGGFMETREQESILHFGGDDVKDTNRNESSMGLASYNHPCEGCINLELTIS